MRLCWVIVVSILQQCEEPGCSASFRKHSQLTIHTARHSGTQPFKSVSALTLCGTNTNDPVLPGVPMKAALQLLTSPVNSSGMRKHMKVGGGGGGRRLMIRDTPMNGGY